MSEAARIQTSAAARIQMSAAARIPTAMDAAAIVARNGNLEKELITHFAPTRRVTLVTRFKT